MAEIKLIRTPAWRPPVRPMNSSVPGGRIRAAPSRAAASVDTMPWPTCRRTSLWSMSARAEETGPGNGDKDMVDRSRQLGEVPLPAGQVVGVEAGRAAGAELIGRIAEPVRVAPGQDRLGVLHPGHASGLQPDARAPADHDDGLAFQIGHDRSQVRPADSSLARVRVLPSMCARSGLRL